MSMVPFDHPFWLHVRQMVINIGATPVEKPASLMIEAHHASDDWGSPS
jgi:hypothetical protein